MTLNELTPFSRDYLGQLYAARPELRMYIPDARLPPSKGSRRSRTRQCNDGLRYRVTAVKTFILLCKVFGLFGRQCSCQPPAVRKWKIVAVLALIIVTGVAIGLSLFHEAKPTAHGQAQDARAQALDPRGKHVFTQARLPSEPERSPQKDML